MSLTDFTLATQDFATDDLYFCLREEGSIIYLVAYLNRCALMPAFVLASRRLAMRYPPCIAQRARYGCGDCRDATDADRVLRFARSQEWFCAFSAWISSLSSYSRSAYFSGDTDIFLNIPYVCDTITCADECLERARALSERICLRDGMCACVRGGAARARPVRCLWTALSAFEP